MVGAVGLGVAWSGMVFGHCDCPSLEASSTSKDQSQERVRAEVRASGPDVLWHGH